MKSGAELELGLVAETNFTAYSTILSDVGTRFTRSWYDAISDFVMTGLNTWFLDVVVSRTIAISSFLEGYSILRLNINRSN